MKKKIAILIVALMLLAITACGKTGEGDITATATEAPRATEKPIEATVTAAVTATATATATPTPYEIPEYTGVPIPTEAVLEEGFIRLDKSYYSLSESNDSDVLVQSDYAIVSLNKSEEERCPGLKASIDMFMTMIKNTLDDEFDNIKVVTHEMADQDEDYFLNNDTLRCWSDVSVRRSDNIAVSLLLESKSNIGDSSEGNILLGFNFDPVSGAPLEISDVIRDKTKAAELATKSVERSMWTGNLFSETAIKDFLVNSDEAEISWTLDYDGVTFYFAPGDIADEGFGKVTAKVFFKDNPGIFNEKYSVTPKEYIVELPNGTEYYVDLNGDGKQELIIVSPDYNNEVRYNNGVNVITGSNSIYVAEPAAEYEAVLAKTEDDKFFVYIFLKTNKLGESGLLVPILTINANGEIYSCGMAVGSMASVESDEGRKFEFPTNMSEVFHEQDFKKLEGTWSIDGDNDTASIYFSAYGTFKAFYASGSEEASGVVVLHEGYYKLYSMDDLSEEYLSFKDDGSDVMTEFSIGTDTKVRFLRVK